MTRITVLVLKVTDAKVAREMRSVIEEIRLQEGTQKVPPHRWLARLRAARDALQKVDFPAT